MSKNVNVEFALIPSMWADVAELQINHRKENNSPDYSLDFLRVMVDSYIREKSTYRYWDFFRIECPEEFDILLTEVIKNHIRRCPQQVRVFYQIQFEGHWEWECIDPKAFMEKYNERMCNTVTELLTQAITKQ